MVDAVPVGVAARLLGVSDNTVRRMVRAGKLASWRTPGGHRRLDLSDVTAARSALRTSEQPQERHATAAAATGGGSPASAVGAFRPQLDDKAGIFVGDTAEALADMAFAVLRDPALLAVAQAEMSAAMQRVIDSHSTASSSPARRRKGRS